MIPHRSWIACAAVVAVLASGCTGPSGTDPPKAAKAASAKADSVGRATATPSATTSPAATQPGEGRTSAPEGTGTASGPTPAASSRAPESYALLTGVPAGAGKDLLPRMTVFGDPKSRCVWLGRPGGWADYTTVVWPPGFRARFSPLRIYDKTGREVWNESERRDVVGGWVSFDRAERISKPCRTDWGPAAWAVTRLDPPSPLPPGGYELPTWGPAQGGMAALWQHAPVYGDAKLRCVWLGKPGEPRYDYTAVLWPVGYWARFNPLRIYDEGGKEVWNEFERRDLGGGFTEVHEGRIPKACRTPGNPWHISNVSPAGSILGDPPPDELPSPEPTASP